VTSQEFEDHGQFAPCKEVQVHYEPWRDRIIIYSLMGRFADGCRLYVTRRDGDSPYMMVVAPQEEPPLYLTLGSDEADAIADAIRPRPQVNERHLADTIEVRDRLLTLIEAEQIGRGGGDTADPAADHVRRESEYRRNPRMVVRGS
jgi:hypothetical protein